MWPIPLPEGGYYTPSKDRGDYLRTVPVEFQDKVCKCGDGARTNPGWVRVPDKGQFWVHMACGKPTDIWNYIVECVCCEELYFVDFMPDRMQLCLSCKEAN